VTWETAVRLRSVMVSRRRILSQSRDELSFRARQETEEDDTWYNKDKLYKDHLQEVLDKWDSIDDEIWAKIVVLERNRRVAKAYARAPVLTVNGTDQGFDGFRIGLSGFENPMRDIGTEESLKQINQGFKLKMDDLGNILIKRLTKSPVYAVNTAEENSLDHEIIKLQNGLLEFEKPFKLFDMKKFQQNVNREMKRQYPERRKLERQCISVISFGSSTDILDCPIWLLCINVVAMEMLRTKLPPGRGPLILDNARHGLVGLGSSDEDPYSVAGSGSSGSSGNGNRVRSSSRGRDCPPQLPPRDNTGGIYSSHGGVWSNVSSTETEGSNTRAKKEKKKTGDDPYYFGLSARIPNFVKSRKKKQKERNRVAAGQFPDSGHYSTAPSSLPSHPFWWHSRIYQDTAGNGGGEGAGFTRAPTSFVPYVTDSSDSDYSHIYGRLPMVNKAVRKFPTKPLFLSQWE